MKKYLPGKHSAKAVASALVVVAVYLIGVIPATGGFGDVSLKDWLGLVVAVGGAYGVTYAAPKNTPVPPQ